MTYDIIYADPPWKYMHGTPDREIEDHYPTMDIEDICNIEVPANDNCILYLWATSPLIEAALKVLNAWGFTYKSQMIWDKELFGMGFWFRGQHEILLVGTKGNVSPPLQPLRIRSVYREKRTAHSKKPVYIRNMIDEWYPNMSKIELFARTTDSKWAAFGNEVSKTKQLF